METWETLTMSRKEVPRAGLVKAALAGRISNAQGARALELSVRQFQRVKRRFAADGAPGLRHRLRGRPSLRRLGAAVLARAAWGLRDAYAGLNDCHVTEKLQEVEGLRLSRSSVRRLRRALGLPPKRRRRGRSGRTRRTPAAQLGALVRNDAHWTLAEELAGTQAPTHFGRILQDLGIGFIAAHSPQAKGRIERFWQTLQDRLVSELRLRGIATLEAANAFLPLFLADLNTRFARPPADPRGAWRPAPRDLAAALSCRYTRRVAHDNTVRLGPRWVQLPRRRSYAGRRVDLRECLDGRLLVFADGTCLATQPAPPAFILRPRRSPNSDRPRRAHAASAPPTRRPPAPSPRASRPPAATHPWRHAVPYARSSRGMT